MLKTLIHVWAVIQGKLKQTNQTVMKKHSDGKHITCLFSPQSNEYIHLQQETDQRVFFHQCLTEAEVLQPEIFGKQTSRGGWQCSVCVWAGHEKFGFTVYWKQRRQEESV